MAPDIVQPASTTLIILFTDLEGSTRLWQKFPMAMPTALERHDEIIRTAVENANGRVVKSTGDGFYAVFESALEGLNACIAAQKRLVEESWPGTSLPKHERLDLRVRMGLHAGEVQARGGDYFGTAVNRAARLMSAANGGQALLSEAMSGMLTGRLPDGVSLRDLGEYHLKDLLRPEHIFQILYPGLPADFPPLRSLSTTLTNIPAQTTSFVGREEEVANLQALLDQEEIRLVTLVGPGGTGKTRLAIEVAANQIGRFRDGVFFVALAPLSDSSQIVQAIIEAASITMASGGDLQTQLLRYLRRKKMLLVLDNFEHLLEGARFLSDILAASPGISILATSRERLNLSGENVLVLGGLQVTEWHTPEDVMAHSAGQLFIQCVQRIQPGFELAAEDIPHVTKICRLTQGMPLAILLAASWADMLSLQEIAAEIENSLDFLETELRDIPARQRSIRAVFEGSWEKLPAPKRALFKRLSVFRGGFTREAAEEVAGASLRSLARLVNKSFLTHDPATQRYAVHELLRQYAAERLQAEPGAISAVQEAHTAYFTELMIKMWELLRSNRQREMLDEIEADIENVRAAWRHLTSQNKTREMGRIVNPLWYLHELRGWYHAGLDLFNLGEKALRGSITDDQSAVTLAQIQAARGVYLTIVGSPQKGLELGEESLATFRKLNRPRESLLTYLCLGVTNYFLGRGEAAIQIGLELKEISADLEDDWWIAFSLNSLGSAYMTAQASKTARQFAEESSKAWERIGDPWGSIWPGTVLARLAVIDGNYAEARKRYQFVLTTAQSIGFKRGQQYTLISLGNVSFQLGNHSEAEDYYLQSLGISDETGQTREMLATLYDLAQLRAATDRTSEAVELLASILQHPGRFQHGLFRRATIEEDAEMLRGELENQLDSGTYAAAWKRGAGCDLQNAVDEVLAADFHENHSS
jgi:predicted ATPase/class 3 adenylate cyclase